MKLRKLLFALCVTSIGAVAQAQIQTAGTLFVNVDATAVPTGPLLSVTNSGSLGGSMAATGGGTTVPLGTNVAGLSAIVFDGSNDYLQLTNLAGGPLIPPPLGIVGVNATASIEVWAYNPAVGTEETMVAWGRRGTAGANCAFGYGYSGQLGAVCHTGSGAPDLGWDDNGGAPLNNKWHHLVYTYDGTTTRVYSDGALVNVETQPINTSTNAGIMLGAQWNAAGTAVGAQYGSLALARVRIHDGTLSAAQILNNYNFEKATFQTVVSPTLLASGPAHRYSFNDPATNDATGLAITDSVGTAHGVVQGSPGVAPVAAFSGSRLILPGGPLTTGAYGDLPNGLLSANSTNNSGTGEFSIEVWFKVSNSRVWSHVFDFGSSGLLGSSPTEITAPGGQSGLTALDDFMYGAQVNADVNRHRLEWGNRDIDPSGSTTNPTVNVEVTQYGVVNTDRHVVVTWKESTGQIIAYENGIQVATLTISNAMSAINDINNWLGRTQYGSDNTMQGEFDEVRIYNRVLTAGEALGDFQAGANVLNTSATLAIATQPQNATVFQGGGAAFTVSAGGTPPLFYQWRRNGTPITGATSTLYQTANASTANNGDEYSCLVSNLTTSTISSTGVLTVIPNQAPPLQALRETRDGNRDNFAGVVGCSFKVGEVDAPVTHLGFYDLNQDGLNLNHRVGIFSADGSVLIASVTVPAGTGATLVNGYRYVALDTPLLLSANTTYLLGAESFNGGGDGWPDNFTPLNWNPAIVGTNSFDTRASRWTGSVWPAFPVNSQTLNGTYGAPNLATVPLGPPLVGVAQTNVTQYAGLSVTLRAIANGEAPVGLQWYKAPSTLLTGQTNSALTLANVVVGNSGDYYVIATNALGSAQSSNVTLTVLADTPVFITQQPTNTSAPEGFPVTFTIGASGTPPIFYQWRVGGVPIPDATNATYSIAGVAAANNGQVYSCVVSNFANSSPQTQTSANATLTVQPNRAIPSQILHETFDGNRDNFAGVVGGVFQVGASDALVTHVGYYDLNGDSLNFSHRVGIFNVNGGALIAFATVPSGTDGYLTNGYRWVALSQPIILTNNASYVIGAEVFSGSGDGWADQFVPANWNPYYVGVQGTTTRQSRFGGAAWPAYPAGASTLNAIYGAPMLGVLPIGSPVVAVQQTNFARYVGESVTMSALVNGQTPLTLQWYKAPSTLLTGQTNASLTLSGLTIGDSGNYYLVGSNPLGSTASSNVTLSVLALTPPLITQQPQPQSVYLHQVAQFSVGAVGQQPLSYQWSFNGSPIAGATTSTLAVFDATVAKVGNYSVAITNVLGSTNSGSAALQVLNPPPGSYPVAVLNQTPLVYYRFSDVNDGTNAAFNLGSLGATHNGIYEGSFLGDAGPQPPAFPNFETNNLAFKDDSLAAQVKIPDVTLNTNSGAHATFVAWINRNGPQVDNAGIVFSRANNMASGLGVKQLAGDLLMYHWNNLYFGFNSGLSVPDQQWTFVALVVEPTQATLYLNNGSGMQSATNVAEHLAVPLLGSSYVGWDSNSGTRRFYGMIDEPMIFDRSLSPSDINALYQAAVLPVVELTITRSAGNTVLSWPAGTLQESDEAAGPYNDLTGVTSPYTNAPVATKKFYRVRVQ